MFFLLKKRLDDILELKNDLVLTRHLTKKEKNEYLKTILKIASKKQNKKEKDMIHLPSLGLINHTSGSILKKRFQLVLHQTEKTFRQKISSFLFTFILVAMFAVSYLFVIQPAGFPPEYYEGTATPVYEKTSYLLYQDDGTYSYYENDTYKYKVTDITKKPFCDLEIIK